MFELLDEVEDLNEASEEASVQQSAAEILSLPGGQWLLIAVGLFIAGVGVGNVLKAIFGDFGRRLGCRETTRLWACRLGRMATRPWGRLLPLGYTVCAPGGHGAGARGPRAPAIAGAPAAGRGCGLRRLGLIASACSPCRGALRRIDVPDVGT